MSAETAAVLRKARSLIDTPRKWVKGEVASDINGIGTPSMSEAAVCFCTMGAVWRAAQHRLDIEIPAVSALRRVMLDTSEYGSIAEWNDTPERTHAEVLAAFDAAIAAEEATP